MDLPQLHQAIAISLCLVDFELEHPQVKPIPPGWKADLMLTREALAGLHRRFERARRAADIEQPAVGKMPESTGRKRRRPRY